MKNRTKRRICGWISVAGFITSFAGVAAVEQNTVDLGFGSLLMFGGIFVFGLAAYKGGYMQ